MTVLVTGGAGYIGSHLAHLLVDIGEELVVVDDLSTGFQNALPDKAVFARGDIADEAFLRSTMRAHKASAVIHLAGSSVVPDSVADPLKYYGNNVSASRVLLAACLAEGVRQFIFSSSAAVYGAAHDAPVDETAPTHPTSPYGRSKLMIEWMLEDVARANPEFSYVALRYFNVAGADPEGRIGQRTANATHLIKVACEAAAGKRPSVAIFGDDYPTADGTCVRDYIHVQDLAMAHLLGLRRLRAQPGSLVLNCGYGRGYSVSEVIRTVKAVSGVNFPVRIEERRPGDNAFVVAANERVREFLGWNPQFDDVETIVRHALAWELRNG